MRGRVPGAASDGVRELLNETGYPRDLDLDGRSVPLADVAGVCLQAP